MTAKFSQVSLTGGDGLAKAAVPEAPLAVLASPGNNQVPLRWLESFGATGYRVKRSLTSGGPYSPVATVAGTSCVDGTAKNGARYYYVVTAVNAAGESPNSKEDSVAPLAPQINIALGGTATSATNSGMATGDGSSPEGPDKAFDQNAGTKWYTGGDTGTTGWLEYAFPAGTRRTVQSYRLTSANDVPGRDPKDWQLLGSNDGTNWTTLDARIGQQFSDRFQALSYTIASPAAYRFYRLNITAIADPVANSIQLAELALKGVVP
jgi:hypothetical protein